ncbi:hypothetical protein [Algoriphagus resistens]|uniref:hypothetical protein n=1 Tax=Algoriphagus resistens TaxID=1750590 RepID=UPI000716BDA6|nr:hypothetical protein [Algoriphagus resistens]
MNRQEKRIYFKLTIAQGSYYVLLGFIIMLFSIKANRIAESLILEFNSALVGSLIIGIGCALYAGKKYKKVPLSLCVLGLVSSGSILLNQINGALESQSTLFQNFDLLAELVFMLLWLYLAYWKWVSRKFSKFNSDN